MYNENDEIKKINTKYGKIKLNLKKSLFIFSTQFIILTTNSTMMINNNETNEYLYAIHFTSLTTLIPLIVIIMEIKEINNCMNEKDKIIKKIKSKNQ